MVNEADVDGQNGRAVTGVDRDGALVVACHSIAKGRMTF